MAKVFEDRYDVQGGRPSDIVAQRIAKVRRSLLIAHDSTYMLLGHRSRKAILASRRYLHVFRIHQRDTGDS